MSLTRVADVLDKLYDLFVADATLAAAVTAQTLRIYDGPPITDLSAPSVLCVGAQPSVDEEVGTSVTWEWSSSGTSGHFADIAELIDVPCGIYHLTGDSNDMRAARRAAIGLYAAAAEAVRASTLNIDVVMWCTTAVSSIVQTQTTKGAEVLIRFTARVRTQI